VFEIEASHARAPAMTRDNCSKDEGTLGHPAQKHLTENCSSESGYVATYPKKIYSSLHPIPILRSVLLALRQRSRLDCAGHSYQVKRPNM
jgi:hypothetical protein